MAGISIAQSVSSDDWNAIRAELERLEMNVIEMQEMAFIGGQDNVDAKATRLVGDPEDPKAIGNLTGLLGRLDEVLRFFQILLGIIFFFRLDFIDANCIFQRDCESRFDYL